MAWPGAAQPSWFVMKTITLAATYKEITKHLETVNKFQIRKTRMRRNTIASLSCSHLTIISPLQRYTEHCFVLSVCYYTKLGKRHPPFHGSEPRKGISIIHREHLTKQFACLDAKLKFDKSPNQTCAHSHQVTAKTWCCWFLTECQSPIPEVCNSENRNICCLWAPT